MPTYTLRRTNTPVPKPTSTATPSVTYSYLEIIPYTPVSVPTLLPTIPPTVVVMAIPTPRIIALATPTPTSRRLEEVPREPTSCISDYEPPWDYVDWLSGPTVSATGMLELSAKIDDGVELVVPGEQGYNNINLTDDSSELYGSVVPPNQPRWDWVPRPGLWIAERYAYADRTLTVRAQIDPAAATHPGLELCLWSGGTKEQSQLLGLARKFGILDEFTGKAVRPGSLFGINRGRPKILGDVASPFPVSVVAWCSPALAIH